MIWALIKKYLLDIHQFISEGKCSSETILRNPGIMVHTGWLTTANRVLWLYVVTEYTSNKTDLIVACTIKVYVPMCFKVKCDLPRNWGSGCVPDDWIFERNRSCGTRHCTSSYTLLENILLTIINDERSHIL